MSNADFAFGPPRITAIVTTVLIVTFQLLGQSFTGSISGLIADATGAVVQSVSITVTDLDKNTTFRTNSNETGFYVVPSLAPGRYRITAEKAGFRTYVLEPLLLATQQKAELNVRLELGGVTERVQVSAESQQLEPNSSTLSGVVENKRIVDLPLNGRNIYQLAALVPGVFAEAPAAQAGSSFMFMSNRFMVNGGLDEGSDIMVDGVSASVPHNNGNILGISAVPSVEGVQEFRIQTNAYSAEYGRSSGGLVTLVTKSGTNEPHGSLFEFLRNSIMDSNSWQANNAGIKLASFKRNQFGASFGGPVYLPKLYNGRNHTFFFIVFDGDRTLAASTGQFTVPTALERQGNFSQTFAANGQMEVVYNPFTTRPDPARPGGFIRDPFPGNQIPANLQNPVALNSQKYFPAPTNAGLPITQANNFVVQITAPQPTDRVDLKIDHIFNERQRMFGRYSVNDTVQPDPNYWNSVAMPNNGPLYQRLQSAALDYTQTIGTAAVFNIAYGFGRNGGTRNPPGYPFDPTQLGFPPGIAKAADEIIFPTFTIADVAQLGPASGSYWRMRNYSHNIIANLSRVQGRHSLKFGIDTRLNYVNFLQAGSTTGGYTFSRAQTQGPDPLTPSTVGGVGYASFLLGVGASGSLPKTIMPANANHYIGWYVNDDFKVSTKLTLNLGFRWDFESGVTERYNRIGGIDLSVANPLSSQVGLNLYGGYVYPGKGLGSAIRPVDPGELNPRLGLAYQLDSKTVMRSGYGIFFGLPSYTANPRFIPAGYSSSTPWMALAADTVTPLNLLSNPFPNGFILPQGNVGGLNTQVGQSLTGAWPAALLPAYNQQWNFTIQRSLANDMLVEVAYAGNKGTHLHMNNSAQLDQIPAQDLSLGNALLQQVPNPFYGIITAGNLSTPTIQRGYLLRPYPEWDGVTAVYADWGNSNFNALEARLEKRFSQGLSVHLAYTFSKNIDDAGTDGGWATGLSLRNADCRACDRALSSYDQRNRFVANFNYELPVGHGKSLGSNWNKWTDAVLGRWQINGILTLSSGLPLVFAVPQNTSYSFGGTQTPVVTGADPNLGSSQTLKEWFNTSIFSQPANFTFGTMARVASDLRSNGLKNLDFSVFKSFRFRERAAVQLRGEAFNLMNHPEFSAPGTTVNTPLFGVVTSQTNLPRQLQIGLKILF